MDTKRVARIVLLLLFILLLLGVISIRSKISAAQAIRATVTQRSLLFETERADLHRVWTQTANAYETQAALEQELAEFSEKFAVLASVEDCLQGDPCDNWARKVLVIRVLNSSKRAVSLKTTLSCESTVDISKPFGNEAVEMRCGAFYHPTLDSVDYIRNICLEFSASIIVMDDARANVCADVINVPGV